MTTIENIEQKFKEVTNLNDLTLDKWPIFQSDFENQKQDTSKEASKERGYVTTPIFLVDEMIGMKKDELSPSLKSLDLCSGEAGQFTVRLMRYLYNEYHMNDNDLSEWFKNYHTMIEIDPQACGKLVYIYGKNINLYCGDATKLSLANDNDYGIMFLEGNEWKHNDLIDDILKNDVILTSYKFTTFLFENKDNNDILNKLIILFEKIEKFNDSIKIEALNKFIDKIIELNNKDKMLIDSTFKKSLKKTSIKNTNVKEISENKIIIEPNDNFKDDIKVNNIDIKNDVSFKSNDLISNDIDVENENMKNMESENIMIENNDINEDVIKELNSDLNNLSGNLYENDIKAITNNLQNDNFEKILNDTIENRLTLKKKNKKNDTKDEDISIDEYSENDDNEESEECKDANEDLNEDVEDIDLSDESTSNESIMKILLNIQKMIKSQSNEIKELRNEIKNLKKHNKIDKSDKKEEALHKKSKSVSNNNTQTKLSIEDEMNLLNNY